MINTKYSISSNRSFGLLFAVVCLLFSAYAAFRGSVVLIVFVWLTGAIVFVVVAVVAPRLLMPFNKAWMMLGELMSKVVSPLVLGLIFFVLITPTAVFSRLFGRDELRLNRLKANSYWIDRMPPGPTGDSFNNQF